ncbi:MAG: VRR-NUC domain-containing protein, partial [Lysobacterales bacterium]
QLEAALDLCREMQEQAWCEEELEFLQRQIPLLQKKLGLDHQAPARLSYPQERLQLPRGEAGVELDAAAHYLGSWQQVHFVENSLINTLFGLALWEEMFLPVAGAFVNPFQSAPLDMHTQEFYHRRQAAIDARLERLASTEMAGQILASYDRHLGLSNYWVNWRDIDRDLVSTALKSIPGKHLLAIWRRILFDPRANRSGFPDLLALDPGRGYCMIEVKGPGDQLQHNQKRWLRFFQSEQIPCLVAWVDWRDA